MLRKRIIPSLQLAGPRLVKSWRFGPSTYLGDPVNAVKIFNEKEVDEILLLDITCTREGREPDYALLEEIASEAFVPVTYGGGVRSVEAGRRLLRAGIEKLAVNTWALADPSAVRRLAEAFGSQCLVAVIDVRRGRVFSHAGLRPPEPDPGRWALHLQEQGAGELLVQSVDRDGTLAGFDLELLAGLPSGLRVPVLAAGGAGSVADMQAALATGRLDGLAVGARFVFYGPLRAVLINYLTPAERRCLG